MSRRDVVRMTPDEVDAYLAEPLLCRIGTIGPGGTIHLVAMNYGFVDGVPSFWSYRKAQKVLNIQRDPAVGMIVDTGVAYAALKGVHLMGRAEIIDDPAVVAELGRSMLERYGASNEKAALSSAPKRVVVKVHADKVISWDHAKLDGGY